jgi:hypothetical protein
MPPRKRNTPTPKVDESMVVDSTVKNQESLGSAEVVDRREPVLVTDDSGTTFDKSGPAPEIVDPNKDETEARNARLRQTEAALSAKEGKQDLSKDKVNLEFVETGLTVMGKVWKRGEVLTLDPEARNLEQDTEGNVWYEMSTDDQKERFGKVFFERK